MMSRCVTLTMITTWLMIVSMDIDPSTLVVGVGVVGDGVKKY